MPTAPKPEATWAFFLDIDGTLAGLARTPSAVRIDEKLRAVVGMLCRTTGGAVALVTGRGIGDVDRLFPGARLPVAGQHGVERRAASGRISRHRFPAASLRRAKARLEAAADRHRQLVLEDKGLSLALHYRRAPRLGGYAHHLVREAARQLGPGFVVQSGKRVVELRPSGRDKGTAILEFSREPPFRGRLPVFIGDDASDEHGFAMVNRLGGHSVKVGPGRTLARWRLPDVAAVRGWLERGTPEPAATSSPSGRRPPPPVGQRRSATRHRTGS